MTRYTVVWHDDAQNQLAKIWLSASDRQSVTLAATATDRHLAEDANTKGVVVEGSLRQVILPSLRHLCAASEADRMVRILDVASALRPTTYRLSYAVPCDELRSVTCDAPTCASTSSSLGRRSLPSSGRDKMKMKLR